MKFFPSFCMSLLVLSTTLISACGKSSSNNNTPSSTSVTYTEVDYNTITKHFVNNNDNYWMKDQDDSDLNKAYGIRIEKGQNYKACYPSDQVNASASASVKDVVYEDIHYYYKNKDTSIIYLVTGSQNPNDILFDEKQIIGTYAINTRQITQYPDINHSGLSGGQYHKIEDYYDLSILLSICTFGNVG